MTAQTEAGRIADRVDGSEALDRGARLGLVAYGLVHLVVALTAADLALGSGEDTNASQQGAFAELASTAMGRATLYAVAAGFAALVVWQAVEAAVGHRSRHGWQRARKRVGSAGKAVVYAVLGWSAAATATGSSGGGGTDGLTARIMGAPGGQLLVGALGAGVVALGGYVAYRGWSGRFTRGLDAEARSRGRWGPIVLVGTVGHIGKGASLAAVGALFVVAAVQHRPSRSGGLDAALHQLLREPYGAVLVGGVALGLACFGLYCFAWARHLERRG